MQAINAKWTEYNNTYNEGCEGYNPHPKYITTFVAPTVSRPAAAKMIGGKLRTEADARKFANNCLSGAQRAAFLSQVDAAFSA